MTLTGVLSLVSSQHHTWLLCFVFFKPEEADKGVRIPHLLGIGYFRSVTLGRRNEKMANPVTYYPILFNL